VADSRRERFDIHIDEEARLLRCLLCQQWIEADHEEALSLDRARMAGGGPEGATGETHFEILR
jgi:hypothetical protein